MSGNYSFHAVVTSPPRLTARGGDGGRDGLGNYPPFLPLTQAANDGGGSESGLPREIGWSHGNCHFSPLRPPMPRSGETGRAGGGGGGRNNGKTNGGGDSTKKKLFCCHPSKRQELFPYFFSLPSREKGRGNKAPPSLKATPSPSSSSLVRSEVEGREEEVGRFFSSVPLRQCPPGVGCGGGRGGGGGGVRKICSWHFCTFRGASPLFPAPRISLCGLTRYG